MNDNAYAPTSSSSDPAPAYIPRPRPPNYSTRPASGEQCLQISRTLAAHLRDIPRGTLKRRSSFITVSIEEQNEGDERPTYGRGRCILGSVHLEQTHGVTSVEVKVRLHAVPVARPCCSFKFAIFASSKAALM